MLDFAFAPGQRNADVLIFGDSSAFIGIDPRTLESRLGVKALLLPNTIGSLPIIGDIPLRRYLATHAAPKLLVFYFSPWNLNYTHAKKVRFFEGEEMMLRHGTAGEIADFALRHPAEVIFFPFRFYNAYGLGILRSMLRHAPPEASVQLALGHMDDRDPIAPLADTCKIPSKLFADKSNASIQTLADKYLGKVPVLVYMAPIPQCRNTAAALPGSYSGLNAAPPVVLPAGDFVGDIYYAHLEPEAVPTGTLLLAEAVKKRLSATPTEAPGR